MPRELRLFVKFVKKEVSDMSILEEFKTMVKADAIEVKTNAEKAKETVERS